MRRLLPLLLALLPGMAGATVSTTHAHVDVVSTGSTMDDVPITMEFFTGDHIEVVSIDDDDVETALTPGLDYEVTAPTGDLPSTSSLDILVPVTAGQTIRIRRVVPVEQVVNLLTAGRYDPNSIEKGMDLLTMMIQQLEEGSLPVAAYVHGNQAGGALHAEVIRGDHTVDNSGTCGFICGDNYDLLLDHVDDVGTGTVSATNPHGISPYDIGLLYDVKAFGALGNGSADDTAEIQAAIDAAGVAGGVVYFPPGTYIVSHVDSDGTIFTITDSNIIFRGAGRKVSIVKSSSGMGAGHIVFLVDGASRVLIEDVGVQATNDSDSSSAIAFTGATDSSLHRVWVDDQFGWSVFIGEDSQHTTVTELESAGTYSSNNIEVNGSSYTTIEGCDLTGSGHSSNAIELYDGIASRVTGTKVINNWIHGTPASGILSLGTIGTLIDGNTVEGATTAGIHVVNSELVPARTGSGVSIKGNTVRNNAVGIYVAGSSEVAISDGNYITGSTGTGQGILVDYAAVRATITGNLVTLNGGTGINVSNGYAYVVGNVCTNNSQAGAGLRYGISIEATATDAVVIGNDCSDTQTVHTQQFGVLVNTNAPDAVVIGNKAFGTLSYGVIDGGARTVMFGNRQDAGGGLLVADRSQAPAVPYQSVATSVSLTTCDSTLKGARAYADDTNDTALSREYFCGTAADDSTYAWRRGDAPGIVLGASPPTITGNVQTGMAADNLLAQLATFGLITDSSTAVPSIQAAAVVATTPNPSATQTCDSITRGTLLYVDDSDDGAVSYMCFCGTAADDTTYGWRKVDGGAACP